MLKNSIQNVINFLSLTIYDVLIHVFKMDMKAKGAQNNVVFEELK